MNVFVVFSLSGEAPGVAAGPVGSGVEARRGRPWMMVPAVADRGTGRPVRRDPALAERCAGLEEENRLMKEELNELYLRYDRLCAAFGEVNHFMAEAAAAAGRFPGEGEEA